MQIISAQIGDHAETHDELKVHFLICPHNAHFMGKRGSEESHFSNKCRRPCAGRNQLDDHSNTVRSNKPKVTLDFRNFFSAWRRKLL